MNRLKDVFLGCCLCCLAAISFLLNGGCGHRDEGPVRYDLSGTVVVANQPAVSGTVTFMPDDQQGNAGPGTTALIDSGKYRTAPGFGTVGGPHVIEITAFLSPPDDNDSADAGIPPVRYRTEVDLPHETGVQDFQIPAPGSVKNSRR